MTLHASETRIRPIPHSRIWADGRWHSGHIEAWTKDWARQRVGIAYWEPQPGREVHQPVRHRLRSRDGATRLLAAALALSSLDPSPGWAAFVAVDVACSPSPRAGIAAR